MGECNLWFTQLQATGLFPNDTLRLNLTKKRNMLRPIATIAVNVPQAVFCLATVLQIYWVTTQLPQIVAFRNQLIHGYARVRALTVWNVAQSSLPALLVCVPALLEELGEG
ncbi:MAG: DUF86 domain-containing protein [Burkholderiales bacterium]|jgi:hypothetical protein|nr:DUF86 domain-containing protein [Burkholderiales bacterium]MBK6567324.1 DUF86 domain-containing protein [Burkholderiales bacterium]MBK7282631.1 DUF86 domain-containing protein [Burkholderiales bacterium]MBL0245359.1 DUF86 domain-containing protein [Rhodoferax sp.]